MRKDYDICGSYDAQRYKPLNAERTVNLFEYIDPNGKRPKCMLPTAGILNTNLDFSTASATAGSRASFVFDDAIYQVFGQEVFRISGSTDALSSAHIGTLNTATGYVGIDANNFQVIFVDGTDGWIWDINQNTFEQITDTSFPATPIDVTSLDGFFIVANGGTNEIQLSSLNQGMVWGGGSADFTADAGTDVFTLTTNNLNFATGVPVILTTTGTLPTTVPAINPGDILYIIRVGSATTFPGTVRLATSYENAINNVFIDVTAPGAPTNTMTVDGEVQLGTITSHPGNIVACRTLHRRLFLFSEFYTEVWENAGFGGNLPVRRTNSLLIEFGTPSVGSIATGFDVMIFHAQDRGGLSSVMMIRGSEAAPISNRALDYQLAQYAADPDLGVSDSRGILTKENGLIFYRLNFTAADHTFVYNMSMSTPDQPRWHEEEVLNHSRHPAQTHAYFDGNNYYADYSQPVFYLVDDSLMTNDGEAIRRMRIGRQVTPEGYNRLRIDRFHLDLLQGNVSRTIFDEGFLLTEAGEDILTESGLGLLLLEQQQIISTGQPVVFLSVSKDGAQTFGYLTQGTMGKIGERTHRTVWRKLGTTPRGQGYVPKIEFFNDVPFVVLGAAWDFEVLPE